MIKIFLLIIIPTITCKFLNADGKKSKMNELKGNGIVSQHPGVASVSDAVYPYVVAVTKGNKYICSGALIDRDWVLTSADSLHTLHQLLRILRVRLGSVNYKKGGVLRSVKAIQIHPKYEKDKPNYDLALILLSFPVRYTPAISSIRLQREPKEEQSTHYIVTSWRGADEWKNSTTNNMVSMENIRKHRLLFVTNLHPTDPKDCEEDLTDITNCSTDGMMCLEPNINRMCVRYSGAPVVLNGILWGIMSGWTVNNCSTDNAMPIFVTRVANPNIRMWIHDTRHDYWVT